MDINKEEQIRSLFLDNQPKPYYFISYATFAKLFPPPTPNNLYEHENLNIVDMHLRYHQYVFEEMAPYKWIPGLLVPILARLSASSLLFPLIYVNLFDFYLKPFFVWKHRNDPIINIQREFAVKLSKPINKKRRVYLYQEMENILKQNTKIPHKYLKFGQWTQYTFHTAIDNIEESHLFLTRLFETYLSFTHPKLEDIKAAGEQIKSLFTKFPQFKKDKKEMPELFLNTRKLLEYRTIKADHKFNATKNIENRIRRWLEIWKYHMTGELWMSGFTIDSVTHFNKHYDLLEPQKYNVDTNLADLTIFYSLIAIPKFLSLILRRR